MAGQRKVGGRSARPDRSQGMFIALTEGIDGTSPEEMKTILKRVADPNDPLSGAVFTALEIDVGYGPPGDKDRYGRLFSDEDQPYTVEEIDARTKAATEEFHRRNEAAVREFFGSQDQVDAAVFLLTTELEAPDEHPGFQGNAELQKDIKRQQNVSMLQRVKDNITALNAEGGDQLMLDGSNVKEFLERNGVMVIDAASPGQSPNETTVEQFLGKLKQVAVADDATTLRFSWILMGLVLA